MVLELQEAVADAVGEAARCKIDASAVRRGIVPVRERLVRRAEGSGVAVPLIVEPIKRMYVVTYLPIQPPQRHRVFKSPSIGVR